MVQRKRWGRPGSFTALFCALSIWLCSADAVAAGGSSGLTSKAVRSSDLVIMGRVVGLVDQKPAAKLRKGREVHWVDVVKVLKGSNEAGERFAIRPMGRSWQDGKSYIMFLEWGGSNFANSRYFPALEATKNNLATITHEIATQGAGPTPRRLYYLRHVNGWQLHPSTEFIITEDARFVWSRQPSGAVGGSQVDILRGMLPKSALASLIRQVEGFPTAIAGDDEDRVTVHWRDASGRKRTKGLGSSSRPKAKLILREIETLARRHQKL